MSVDHFAERLATVRHRFASTLASKIKDTYIELPQLSAENPAVIGALDETYRRIHSIAGVGAAVGFAATGRAARKAESVLLIAHSVGRGLKADEMAAFSRELNALRDAAQQELDLAAKSGISPCA